MRDFVAARDAAKDVDQDPLHPRIPGQQLQRAVHHIGLRPAADIEKVGGMTPLALHQVEGVHHQPGAVADDPDGSLEPDVGQLPALRLSFQRILVGLIGAVEVFMAKQGVFVDLQFGVRRHQAAVACERQRVDLDRQRVVGPTQRVQLGDQRRQLRL